MELNEVRVLSALERRPLTVENLAHLLGCSVEDTHRIVQRLWHQGYINTTNATPVTHGTPAHWLMSQILPWGRPSMSAQIHPTSKTYFILTSKGHFRLHPIFSFKEGD